MGVASRGEQGTLVGQLPQKLGIDPLETDFFMR